MEVTKYNQVNKKTINEFCKKYELDLKSLCIAAGLEHQSFIKEFNENNLSKEFKERIFQLFVFNKY